MILDTGDREDQVVMDVVKVEKLKGVEIEGHTWSKTLLDPDFIKFGEEILYEQFLTAPTGTPHFTSPSHTHNIC